MPLVESNDDIWENLATMRCHLFGTNEKGILESQIGAKITWSL